MPTISSEGSAKPEVIIVGAGVGGLLLGQLLEQIEVPYHIFERAEAVKPLGTFDSPCPLLEGLWVGRAL